MRELTDWQLVRLSKIRGPNRLIAPMALGLGMTYQQYRKLTPEQQKACWEAFGVLTRPLCDLKRKPVQEASITE
ncbi:MAG: hypothetical protein ACK4ZU_01960 [Allorhizobium sp.]